MKSLGHCSKISHVSFYFLRAYTVLTRYTLSLWITHMLCGLSFAELLWRKLQCSGAWVRVNC